MHCLGNTQIITFEELLHFVAHCNAIVLAHVPLALNLTTDDTMITAEGNNAIIGYGNLFS